MRVSFAKIRNKTLLIALYALFNLVFFLSGYSVINFSVAEDAEAIIAKGYEAPEGWPAGVLSHQKYYGWWRIEDRPVLFTLSVISLIITGMVIAIRVLRSLLRR